MTSENPDLAKSRYFRFTGALSIGLTLKAIGQVDTDQQPRTDIQTDSIAIPFAHHVVSEGNY